MLQQAAARTPTILAHRLRGLSDRAIAWLFITPTILLLLAINIFPLIWTIWLSFTNYRANQPSQELEWVGLRNYERVLTDSDIWQTLQVTAHFVCWTIVLQMLIGFGLALLINQRFRGHGFWTTLILLPMMLSPAVVGNFWTFLYQPQIGLFNYFVSFFTGIDPCSFQMIGDVNLAPWSIVIVDTWMWTPYVMLICLAGLRSIPDYIYEAAEVDRASPWRQFWSITAADGAAVPDAGGAVPRHRELQDVRPRGRADLGRAGLGHRARLDQPEARGVREVAHRLLLRLRHHPVRDRVRRRQHLRQGAQPGEAAMTGQHRPFRRRAAARRRWVAGAVVILYALITMLPLVWIFVTGFKTPPDSIAYPPKLVFEPTLEGYVNVFTTRSRQTAEYIASLPPAETWYDELVRSRNMVIAGPSKFGQRFMNSVIIGFGSTFLAVFLGTLAAYAFSRFRVPLKDDLLFFILSTRMMPPIAVAIPIFLMYRTLGLSDTQLGLILLYTAVNCQPRRLAAQGLHRRDPARVRGGRDDRRLLAPPGLHEGGAAAGQHRHRRHRHLLPDLRLERVRLRGPADLRRAQTAPPFIPTIIGEGGLDWPAVGAGTTLFLLPILIFTVLLRKHLLRGITFGAVRK